MTLEKTWKECLRMWKWIAGVKSGEFDYSEVEGLSALLLKTIWLTANGYGPVDIFNDCFFCDYANNNGTIRVEHCEGCPGGHEFDCLKDPNYGMDPVGFYNKLVKINKERLSKKGKR